ncbi:MAG: NAD(P)-binding domain-containing protein [Minisyncoccia bacterium]
MQNILIIGWGEIGQALGKILKSKYQIKHWDKNPKKSTSNTNLKDLVLWADIIFLSVPAFALKEILEKIKSNLKNKTIICLSKGIDLKTKEFPHQILEKYSANFGLLYGPMIAEELNKNLYGFAILASKSKKVLNLKNIFNQTKIKVEISKDLTGVCLAGVLKNIYALGLGMIDALNLGKNFKGYYLTCALKEISNIVKAFGAKKETVFLVCGIGDLIATGSSQNSANYMAGFQIVKNKKITKPSEGLKSLKGLKPLIKLKNIKAPILETLYNICFQNKPAKNTLENLLN